MADSRQKMPRPMAVADVLDAVFGGTPTEKRLNEGRIWLVWETVVGGQIAAKAWPTSFRGGTLTVAVASAPWMQQLTFLKTEITGKLNERLGQNLVRDIYLKAGRPQPLPHRKETRETKGRQLTARDLRRIEEQTETIADPELREAFARILARDMEARFSDDS